MNKVNPKEVEQKAKERLSEKEQDTLVNMTFRERVRMVAKAKKVFNSICIDCRQKLILSGGRFNTSDYCKDCQKIIERENGA